MPDYFTQRYLRATLLGKRSSLRGASCWRGMIIHWVCSMCFMAIQGLPQINAHRWRSSMIEPKDAQGDEDYVWILGIAGEEGEADRGRFFRRDEARMGRSRVPAQLLQQNVEAF